MTALRRIADGRLANWIRESRTQILTSLLMRAARAALKHDSAKIIAITGSVGKTTTKDCVATLLASNHAVRRTPYNANDRFGVPRTLLDLPNVFNLKTFLLAAPTILKRLAFGLPRAEFIVLEVGAKYPNTLPSQVKFFRPTISVITAIAPAHLSTLGSIEGVYREKSSIVSALPSSGWAVLCYDDPLVRKMQDITSATSLFYGFSPSAGVWMEEPVRCESGLSSVLHDSSGDIRMTFPRLTNRYHLYAIMVAWCVGLLANIPRAAMAETLQHYSPSHGRGTVFEGPFDSLIYDDSYNANPLSMRSAIETFDSLAEGRRRLIVLGDMLELGGEAEYWHEMVGKSAGRIGDILIAIGTHAGHYASGFSSGHPDRRAFLFSNISDACLALKAEMRPGDAILVKGSHGSMVHQLVGYIRSQFDGEVCKALP